MSEVRKAKKKKECCEEERKGKGGRKGSDSQSFWRTYLQMNQTAPSNF